MCFLNPVVVLTLAFPLQINYNFNNLFDRSTPMKPISTSNFSNRIIATPSPIAKSSFFYLQEAGYLKNLAANNGKRQTLDSYLLIYVLAGEGNIATEKKSYALKEKQCTLINCNQPYSHATADKNPWEILWIHFNGATSHNYFEIFNTLSSPAITVESIRFEEMLRAIIDIHERAIPGFEIKTSEYIVSLLTECILASPSYFISKENRMYEIRAYLDEHYLEKISLDDLAERFQLTKFYISRQFHKTFSLPLFSYIIEKKIHHSKQLLRFSNMNVKDIAIAVGIDDPNYFNKLFNRIEGISPTAYKANWKS